MKQLQGCFSVSCSGTFAVTLCRRQNKNKTILPAKSMPICMLLLDHVVSCNNRCLVSSVVSNYLGFFSFLFRHLCCDTGSPSEQNKTILLTKFMPICMLVLDHVVPCNNICLVCSVVSNYLGFFSFFFRHLYCDTGSPSEQNKTSLPAKFMPICMLVLDHV